MSPETAVLIALALQVLATAVLLVVAWRAIRERDQARALLAELHDLDRSEGRWP